jgi:hypothetical protein
MSPSNLIDLKALAASLEGSTSFEELEREEVVLCAICARPLTHPQSKSIGIGPECLEGVE